MAKTFLTSIDLAGNELRNAVIQKVSTLPAQVNDGAIIFSTAAATRGLHVGSLGVWLRIADSDSIEGLISSMDPQTIMDIVFDQDGLGSGLDADLWRGLSPAQFRSTEIAGVVRLDQLATPTAPVSMNSQRITNLAAPTSSADAATRAYVDARADGVGDYKESARMVTSGNVALSGLNLITGPELTPVNGDRILVRAQTTAAQNGIYIARVGAWERAPDAVAGTLTVGATVYIEDGTENSKTRWILQAMPGAVGTAAQTWVLVGAPLDITAGNGLAVGTDGALNVGAGTGISVLADSVGINTALVVRKAVFNVGGSAAQNLAHNLNSRDVNVSVIRSIAPFDHVECGIESLDLNNVTLRFAVAPAANAFRAIVVG